jgi:hypothetical protein
LCWIIPDYSIKELKNMQVELLIIAGIVLPVAQGIFALSESFEIVDKPNTPTKLVIMGLALDYTLAGIALIML